jgi:hypothetical protein
MDKARLDALYLVILGSILFCLAGILCEFNNATPLSDFKALYYPAQCLVHHGDPYAENEVIRGYETDQGLHPLDTAEVRQISTLNPYPPTVFTLSVPFALLPWVPAHLIWLMLTMSGFILASLLVGNLGARFAPDASGALVFLLLLNSELLIITGNVAGISISLCAVAVCCFYTNRFVFIGIVCFAISLATKPHDTGLVWLYFLLAGGVYRKYALRTLYATIALSLPAVLWVWRVAPHWLQEMRANIVAYSVPGGINDPGPASRGNFGLDMLISLQSAVCFFWDNPRIYNLVSYLICAPLLLIWALFTLRSRSAPGRAWIALAAVVPLSMLPVYHRQLDAALLLLTVPACAMLWAERGRIGKLALLVNTAGFLATGFFPWEVFFHLIARLQPNPSGLSARIQYGAQTLLIPLVLLAMSVFYLWVYVRPGRINVVDANGAAA